MSNWFENNPTKSVVTYTLLVVGATWAGSTFILQDNRLSLAKSELESQKVLTETYKAKAELLQKDSETLRTENAEYRSWLAQTKDAVPIMVPRLNELKDRVATLEASSAQATANGTPSAPPGFTARVGTAFIDESAGLIFTVKSVSVNRTAEVYVKLPDRERPINETAIPGSQWDFIADGVSYRLVVASISFLTDEVGLRVSKKKAK